ncbi:MAG: hypothetical protein LQ345_001672 [Seirophora villosa]|nr:MAG: hypothetical protein LQ345_001672 [Seirophora villosa]
MRHRELRSRRCQGIRLRALEQIKIPKQVKIHPWIKMPRQVRVGLIHQLPLLPKTPTTRRPAQKTALGPIIKQKPDNPKRQGLNSPGNSNSGQSESGENVNLSPTETGDGDGLPANIPDQEDAPEPSRPAVVVEGETIEQGTLPVTIGGKPVEFSPGSVYVDGVATAGSTMANVPRHGSQPILKANPLTPGGSKVTPTVQPEKQGRGGNAAKAKSAPVVQGQTIRQCTPPVTTKGNKVAYSGGSLRLARQRSPAKASQLHRSKSKE